MINKYKHKYKENGIQLNMQTTILNIFMEVEFSHRKYVRLESIVM